MGTEGENRMRIEERLRNNAARHGARPAIVARRVRHGYAELDLKSQRLASVLQGGGVARGGRVALFMDDGWEAVVSAFAVLMAGGVAVPIGAGAAAITLAETLQKIQPVAVITQSRLAAMVATAISPVLSVRLVVLAGGGQARSAGTCISFEETVGRIGRMPPLAAAGEDTDPAVQFGGQALTHCQLAEEAAAASIDGDGIVLPPLAQRAGFVRMLSALDGGHMMIAPAAFARQAGGGRRTEELQPGESAFGISGLLDAAMAGAVPALQR